MVNIANLLTEHMAIWTAAVTEKKSGRGRASGNAGSVYGIKKLRELILELAVRGKLVAQDADDEPASQLLKHIQAEKAKLIAEGKLKKEKPLAPISEDEIPFKAPIGWEWVRVKEIGHDWGQKTPNQEFQYIDVSTIDNQQGIVLSPELIQPEDAPSRARKIVKHNTIVYSTVRPYLLNIAVIDSEFSHEPIASTAFAIIHPHCEMSSRYFLYYLRSPVFIKYVESVQTGIAYPAINDKQFFSGILPLPPLSEQHRIVAKVDELMALCDQLEQQHSNSQEAHKTLVSQLLAMLIQSQDAAEFNTSWQRIYAHFDVLFTTEASIDALKQTLLQLAVMGKLVPQDPNDEPASELLKRIQAEKAKLIAEGKIKKQKSFAMINDDEKPFDLPAGWEWERIATFSIIGTGSTPSRENSSYYSPPEFNWVTSGETSENFVFQTREQVSLKAVQETNVSIYPAGTLIIAMYGQGKTRGQITELMVEAGTNQACAAIQLIEGSSHHRAFIKLFFKKAYEQMRSHSAGGAQPNLNVGKVSLTVVPIAPLDEQHRIVAKVDELMAICDQLKVKIKETEITKRHLADAITQQVVNHHE